MTASDQLMKPHLSIKSCLILIMCVLLTACAAAKITPKKLPDACLGQSYHQALKIHDGVIINSMFYYQVSDGNFILSPKRYSHEKEGDNNTSVIQESYNFLTLEGTPNSLEPITLFIKYHRYRHMLSFFEPNNGFKKTYIIKVKQC